MIAKVCTPPSRSADRIESRVARSRRVCSAAVSVLTGRAGWTRARHKISSASRLPIPAIRQLGPSASCAVLCSGDGDRPRYHGVAEALAEPDTMLRLFGKPQVRGQRRMAVTLARDVDVGAAVAKAVRAASHLRIDP